MKKVSQVNKNFITYTFCIGVALLLIFSLFNTGKQLIRYKRLSQNAWADIDGYKIQEMKKNHYQIWAFGTFSYQGELYHVTAPLAMSYPNPWAAESRIAQMKKDTKMEVWFSPSKVQEVLFVRTFPLHSLLSSLILAGILLYFCGIALYFYKKGYCE